MASIVEQIFTTEFFAMVIPKHDVAMPMEYSRIDLECRELSAEDIIDILDSDKAVTIEIHELGTLIFSNIIDELFKKLQKKYKDYRCYNFAANDTYGYFKILEKGKISRKIASFGYIRKGTVRSYDQVLGKPCEYETETGKIYKIRNGYEHLEGFGRKEVLEIFEYYIGMDNIQDRFIKSIKVYDAVKGNTYGIFK